MRILGIDTALGACSAALLDGERVVAHAHQAMARGHAEALAPMVAAVMREAGCSFAELQRLGVTTGPGTFTGQRVGLAFVRGLALALKIPAIGVTTLDAMAEQALAGGAPWAAIVADAKRDEVYLGAKAAAGEALIAPCLLAIPEALRLLESIATSSGPDLTLGGTAAESFAPVLAGKGLRPQLSTVRQPDAVFVARLAARAGDPSEPPRPLYLRAPDAKLPAAH